MPGMLTLDDERICTPGKDGWWTTDDLAGDCYGDAPDCCENVATVKPGQPDPTDPATAGCLMVLLGPEAWRVRYSPSMHKRAAGVPWIADLPNDVTVHATQGEACVAVAVALGRWGGP
jgi:hypothetical protein